MVVIRATQPHFIRCIKPNEQKAAFVFEPVQVLQQVAAIDCPGARWPGVSPLMRVAWRARADSCAPAACWRRSRSALRATRRARALKSSGSGPFDGKRLTPRPPPLTHGHARTHRQTHVTAQLPVPDPLVALAGGCARGRQAHPGHDRRRRRQVPSGPDQDLSACWPGPFWIQGPTCQLGPL